MKQQPIFRSCSTEEAAVSRKYGDLGLMQWSDYGKWTGRVDCLTLEMSDEDTGCKESGRARRAWLRHMVMRAVSGVVDGNLAQPMLLCTSLSKDGFEVVFLEGWQDSLLLAP